jgi:hypothetical protein
MDPINKHAQVSYMLECLVCNRKFNSTDWGRLNKMMAKHLKLTHNNIEDNDPTVEVHVSAVKGKKIKTNLTKL